MEGLNFSIQAFNEDVESDYVVHGSWGRRFRAWKEFAANILWGVRGPLSEGFRV